MNIYLRRALKMCVKGRTIHHDNQTAEEWYIDEERYRETVYVIGWGRKDTISSYNSCFS